LTTPETPTTTVSECSHGLKKYAKKYQGINFVVQAENAGNYFPQVKTEYVTEEQLQGLWEWYQKTEFARSEVRDLSQKSP